MKIAWPRTSDRETSVSRHRIRFLSPLFVPLFPEGLVWFSGLGDDVVVYDVL
jgi:hypothetical protein